MHGEFQYGRAVRCATACTRVKTTPDKRFFACLVLIKWHLGNAQLFCLARHELFWKQEWTLSSSTVSFLRSGFVEMCGQQSYPHPPPSLHGSLCSQLPSGLRGTTQPNGINQRFFALARHTQGGIGFLCCHKPRRAMRASSSKASQRWQNASLQ